MSAAPQPDPGALSIAPADGYQYGDDHAWTGAQQTGLVARLAKLITSLPTTGDAPLPTAGDAPG
jgi:hypothetical protein